MANDVSMNAVIERINALKKEHNAIILAHNYTLPEIQDVADFVGDSLGLSIKASETDADVIVFCGVSFMAETAKILNPSKTVLIPETDAHCAMAAMCTSDQIKEARRKNPDAIVVGYVNSTAEAKAEMDVCCTSSNAVNVVRSLAEKDVIFVPDENLAGYVASELQEKHIIPWRGFCPIHHAITTCQIEELKRLHPRALVLAHPECRMEVLDMADHIGSTEKILSLTKNSDADEFIVATEIGMLHRLEKACPKKKFYFPDVAICSMMKMVDLRSLLNCMESLSGEVLLSDDVLKRAYAPVKRMTEIK